ncbi:hypothetical protein J2Z83_000734 [Virgibacillus natechei]|uniref:Uncharacterized protein n=1 Tax=Virgibacillus natechei TaxID=1216297 RepID=A0ABS4ICG8_9BACI|nr:hypothetical protein [Virgibacillus natechei]
METGEFDKQYYTGLGEGGEAGLYWRIFDNGVLGMFGLEGVFKAEDQRLTERKVNKARLKYNNPLEVNVKYNNSIIYSEVEVTAESELYMPSFLKDMLGSSNSLQATSSRVVTESPELIRTFNFGKYLWKAIGLQDATEDITNSIDEFFSN